MATPLVITKKTIDIKELIASKNPALSKKIPTFVLNYLNKLLHIDEINEILWNNRHVEGIRFADNILSFFQAKIKCTGLDRIKPDGRYIIAANHPLGGLDGIALISQIGAIRPDIIFPVNDFLLFLPNFGSIFIPVNKVGSNAHNREKLNDLFASDKTILYFPAGLCSRKRKGIIRDLEWKHTFITRAKKNQRDIIPIYIEGQNSKRFYRLDNIRKIFHIKFNLAMILLPDEMFKQKDKTIELIIGHPIDYHTFDQQYTDKQWAELVKMHTYALKNNPDKKFEVQ